MAEQPNFSSLRTPFGFSLFGLDRIVPDWMPITGSPVLHLGVGNKRVPGTEEFDWPEWDAERADLPYDDGSVDAVFCTHFLEHLTRPGLYNVLGEVGRVLRPNCAFSILVPHGQSLMYLQDLDHKTPFVIDTWKTLLSMPYYGKDKNVLPFQIGANFLFGVTERNLTLVTQLIKVA